MRSAMRSRLYMRMALAATAGGANCTKSCNASAGMAEKLPLAAFIDFWMRRSRSTGSASSVARLASRADTRFW